MYAMTPNGYKVHTCSFTNWRVSKRSDLHKYKLLFQESSMKVKPWKYISVFICLLLLYLFAHFEECCSFNIYTNKRKPRYCSQQQTYSKQTL